MVCDNFSNLFVRPKKRSGIFHVPEHWNCITGRITSDNTGQIKKHTMLKRKNITV